MTDPLITIVLPVLGGAAGDSWHGLLDLSEEIPEGWCLIGGFMVQLHCIERGAVPTRPTDDGDAVVDLRARQGMLRDVTGALVRRGFRAGGITADGHQHRWIRRDAVIDVLIPEGVGERAGRVRGIGGGTTLQAPGTTQALDRSSRVGIQHGERIGTIMRPSLLGALVAKAAALSIPEGSRGQRHVVDFCNLAALVGRKDVADLTPKDRGRLRKMLSAATDHPEIVGGVEGAADGLERIALAIRA